ncbi:MAG TPA: hypothetical protein VL947_07155 [Cytophagales bacterium]|nr:hypothetical protein [Cytophagales bacterium]
MACACNNKCKENEGLIVGTWTDNSANYSFYADHTYSYKFLRSNNPADTISVADSAYGTYQIDQCQEVISLIQTGYFAIDDPSTFVPKNINFGTWKFKLVNDSLMEIETATTFMKLRRISNQD